MIILSNFHGCNQKHTDMKTHWDRINIALQRIAWTFSNSEDFASMLERRKVYNAFGSTASLS